MLMMMMLMMMMYDTLVVDDGDDEDDDDSDDSNDTTATNRCHFISAVANGPVVAQNCSLAMAEPQEEQHGFQLEAELEAMTARAAVFSLWNDELVEIGHRVVDKMPRDLYIGVGSGAMCFIQGTFLKPTDYDMTQS
jgi:hypothetical protein